jgi:Zn finger protein HypA/HybF involved in hydrogenase expression
VIGGEGWEETLTLMEKKSEEQVIQKFPHRCPYCDQPISYDQFDLQDGENEIRCPSCKKIYIKVVSEEKSEL